jgi:hypothetical protein
MTGRDDFDTLAACHDRSLDPHEYPEDDGHDKYIEDIKAAADEWLTESIDEVRAAIKRAENPPYRSGPHAACVVTLTEALDRLESAMEALE